MKFTRESQESCHRLLFERYSYFTSCFKCQTRPNFFFSHVAFSGFISHSLWTFSSFSGDAPSALLAIDRFIALVCDEFDLLKAVKSYKSLFLQIARLLRSDCWKLLNNPSTTCANSKLTNHVIQKITENALKNELASSENFWVWFFNSKFSYLYCFN